MSDRYTDRARRVLVLAQDEARNLGHAHVGSGHLLLGLIGEDGGVAAQALKALGVTLEDARRAVGGDRAFCSDPIPAVPLRFTGALTRMLEQAAREAVLLCNNYIGTEHLLLGFIAGSVPGTISLVALGVNPDDARAKVLELLRGYEGAGKRPMTADLLSAALEEIRADILKAEEAGMSRDLDQVIYTHGLMTGTSRRILAVVDAVLRLAGEAEVALSGMPADCSNACALGPCDCSGKGRAMAWDLDPAALREAVTRELTGEASDG